MEDGQSAALATWIDSQAGFAEDWFDAPLRDRTRIRIEELESFEQRYAPVKAGGRYFHAGFPSFATDKTSVYVRSGPQGDARALIGPPYHYGDAVDHDLLRFNGFAPSLDGDIVAYVSSGDGSVWHSARFVDVQSGRLLDDELRGLNRISATVSWSPTGNRLYYVRFDEPRDEDKLSAPVLNGRVYSHVIGQDQAEDLLVFDPGRDDLVPSVTASPDGAFVVVHVMDPRTQTNRVFVRSTAHELRPTQELFRGRPARYTYLDNDGAGFWFYTNDQAPKGRIVHVDLATGKESVVVAERNETMSGGSLVGGNAMGKFADRFVILYTRDGTPLIRVFDVDGQLLHEMPAPTNGSVWGGFVGNPDDPEVYFGFMGMFDPFAVYRLDAATGRYALYDRSGPARLDPQRFEVKQVFYESHDGTRIPMFVVHGRNRAAHRPAPALLYGYGAFGWSSFLFYQSHLVAWLEAGGVYAQPGLRGGGEYGQAWHDAGKGVNKENTVRDYIAAAEWLIDNGYTDTASLVANGGSASAMPVAAAMQRRPELFGAAIIDRPALDMLRFNRFTQGRLWLDEFGAPDTAAEYRKLRELSPYHNLTPGACYPPTLIMIGEADAVTPPLHGYKYTARMQHAQGCANPVLMYLMPGTGHTFGSTPSQVIDSRTAMLVFLRQVLKLEE